MQEDDQEQEQQGGILVAALCPALRAPEGAALPKESRRSPPRIDTIETQMTEQNDVTNEALATIAEIATRTYYASKPSSALPDDIFNANVMDAMIERWPLEWVMRFPTSEFRMLKDLQSLSAAETEAILRQREVVAKDATNAQCPTPSSSADIGDFERGNR